MQVQYHLYWLLCKSIVLRFCGSEQCGWWTEFFEMGIWLVIFLGTLMSIQRLWTPSGMATALPSSWLRKP
jgi:hypothetical protein